MERDTSDSSLGPSDDWGVADSNSQPTADQSAPDQTPDPDPKVKAFVELWAKKIKRAKRYHKKAFDRMRHSMELAKNGHKKEWGDEKFTTPVLMRFINTQVASLYARNPTALAKRKRRRMNTVWDGQLPSLQEAEKAIAMASQNGMPPDPNYMAIAQDVEQVKTYDVLMDGMADTLTLLTQYFVEDPASQYKQQFKALVRRAKVCGVGYVKLSYQRILEQDPDIAVKVSTATEQMTTLRRLIAEQARDQVPDESAELEQLQTLLQDLQAQEYFIANEGPLFTFPKSTNIILDPACYHLKTLAGAGWYAEEFEKTPSDIEELWKKNVRGQYTQYKPENQNLSNVDDEGTPEEGAPAKVWRVMNRKTGQEFTICEGYPFYLSEPAEPEVKLNRFWDIFPLVFNEIEDEKDIFPPSDVWNGRHIQDEYNRAREGLREHRQQNRPAYFTGRGMLEETDLEKIHTHSSGEIITLNQLSPGEDIKTKLMAKPVMQIDPKQYDVTELWNDMLRALGTQQADLGPTTKSTATESAIAEQGRSTTQSDSVDDIDDMLSLLFQATGEIMLREMSEGMVKELVGPGAVWPNMPQTREEVIETIILSIKGGSSGRPNQAANLAKLERAMPFVLQLPGFSPIPLVEKFCEELDLDLEDAVVAGLPSIVALNAAQQRIAQAQAMGGIPQPGTGNPATDPNAQGAQGANNAPQAPGTPPGGQAGFPAPVHFDHQGNPMNGNPRQ